MADTISEKRTDISKSTQNIDSDPKMDSAIDEAFLRKEQQRIEDLKNKIRSAQAAYRDALAGNKGAEKQVKIRLQECKGVLLQMTEDARQYYDQYVVHKNGTSMRQQPSNPGIGRLMNE